MYGFPKNIDLSFFIGRELLQVCIGVNDLILHLDESVTMTITSECSYETSVGMITKIDSYSKEASMICKILGSKIVRAWGNELGVLALKFSNGDTFVLYDDSEQYESYLITRPNEPDIIV